MKLQKLSGRVEFNRGSIEPRTDRTAFLASEIGRTAEVLVDNEPHMTYRFRPEPGIAAAAYFDGARLRTLSWQLELPSDLENIWTVEQELERKRVHDNWLLNEVGQPPYRFSWGRLESNYDPKGCTSAIIVNYVG